MAGLPKVAEIVKKVSEAQAVSQPEQSKTQEAESPETTEETSKENEPLAAAEDGPAKSPENRVPYDRFKEVNDKLKDAHETIAGFERRFQVLESGSAEASDETETTQAEPGLSDKISQMIEDGEIGEGAATLFQDMAAKMEGSAGNSKFLHELQLERATDALSRKIDTAIGETKVHDMRGAKMYLAQTLTNEPNADLSIAIKAWTDWEGAYEQRVLDRHGLKPPQKGEPKAAEEEGTPAPNRASGGGGGGSTSSGEASKGDEPMSLKQIRRRLSKSKRAGR